jgi:cytochrome c553
MPMAVHEMQRRKRSDRKAINLQWAAQAVVCALVLTLTGRAADANAQELSGKIGYCQSCHGPSGQGYRGVFPIPRLSGQTTEYIKSQLEAFAEHRRGDNIEFILSKTHALRPAMRSALASHFAATHSKAIGDGPRNLVGAGKRIYAEGIPEANVPACVACHGENALGSGANARLAGQLYPYTVKRMLNWSKERSDTSNVMAPMAKNMTRAQIEAVAAYLNNLR